MARVRRTVIKEPSMGISEGLKEGPIRGRSSLGGLPAPEGTFIRHLSVRFFCPFLSWKKSRDNLVRARREKENHSGKRDPELTMPSPPLFPQTPSSLKQVRAERSETFK